MRDKFSRFMIGRYGTDEFSRFLLWVSVILMVLNFFVHREGLSLLVFALLGFVYFRMFSKNIQKRYDENCRFLAVKSRVLRGFDSRRSTLEDLKTHHIYRCPQCRQKIRVPRGKGKICITCPKCRTEFTRKS